jgi:GNAT superfamily N-acetyltransferase
MTVIRVAVEKDIPRILDLYHQLATGSPSVDSSYDINPDKYHQAFTQIAASPGLELIIAEEQGKVIGTLLLLIVPNLAHCVSPWAEIENMVVEENYRSQGIGKLLIEYALKKAKGAGCYKIQLCSDNRRARAHEFYQSLGFKASAKGFRLYLK